MSPLCNCSNIECQIQLRQILTRVNAQIENEFKNSPERQIHADLYSIIILCLFATIIIIIMIRAIKPTESVDDQVTIMLNSMRARCEYDEARRHKLKLQKAKLTAKRWLNEAKIKSTSHIRKLSFNRSRSTDPLSVKEDPIESFPCYRATSIQFLPEIVVIDSMTEEDEQPTEEFGSSPPSSKQPSSPGASPTPSLDMASQESLALDIFMD